ncbi:MAG: formimidoylglutamate deiminase [Gammaproteobacteria bacterium]|nr:formimidoylglutamate deiminase [Gammaproteobacteria bacterium]
MAERRIHCHRVMLESGWATGQLLELDSDGFVSAISDHGGEQVDSELKGPVIPGMSNCHSHAFQRLMAGLTSGTSAGVDNFWSWREAMYGFARQLTPEQIEACAAWLYAEMLSAGYTSCGEFHYLHHQADGTPYPNLAETSARILSAANRSGISLTLLPVYYQSSGFGNKGVEPHQRRFANSLDDYLAIIDQVQKMVAHSPVLRSGIAPHSLRAVPTSALAELLGASDDRLPVHIHVAEQLAEVEQCVDHLGARPVQWLLDSVNVDGRWCLVHATHMEPQEARLAAASGAIAGLCPSTEADLGDGFFNAAQWLADGGKMSIGSDSNLVVSPSEELRLLEFTERLRRRQRNVLRSKNQPCGMFLWQHAARNGARAIDQPAGRIAKGCRADLVELNPDHPLLASRSEESILETVVFAGLEGMIRSVFVAGNQVVSDGLHVNHELLAGAFKEVSGALLQA